MASHDRIVVLTGASRGIGHGTVKYFSDKDWRIITCSREDIPAECKRDPNWTHHVVADLGEPGSVAEFIDGTLKILDGQPLHALVNNAAISPKSPSKERQGCLSADMAAWRDVFELNFFTPLLIVRGLAPALAKGKGSVVNITSIAGHSIHPFAGSPYSTSKAALSALTRELAAEMAEFGVRVNAVAPGEIDTAMLSPETEKLIPRIPLHRLGTPEDVAATVYYLCSDEAGYVTGSEIFVTGGQHLF